MWVLPGCSKNPFSPRPLNTLQTPGGGRCELEGVLSPYVVAPRHRADIACGPFSVARQQRAVVDRDGKRSFLQEAERQENHRAGRKLSGESKLCPEGLSGDPQNLSGLGLVAADPTQHRRNVFPLYVLQRLWKQPAHIEAASRTEDPFS